MSCIAVHHCCILPETVWLVIQPVGLKYPVVEAWTSLLFLYTVSQSAGRVWWVAESHGGSHRSNTSNPLWSSLYSSLHSLLLLSLLSSSFLDFFPHSIYFHPPFSILYPPHTLLYPPHSCTHHTPCMFCFSTVATQLDIAVDDEAIPNVWKATWSNSTHHWWAS